MLLCIWFPLDTGVLTVDFFKTLCPDQLQPPPPQEGDLHCIGDAAERRGNACKQRARPRPLAPVKSQAIGHRVRFLEWPHYHPHMDIVAAAKLIIINL